MTVALASVLERSFPDEYAARRDESRSTAAQGTPAAGEAPLPLFVMSCMMPGADFRPSLSLSSCLLGQTIIKISLSGPA